MIPKICHMFWGNPRLSELRMISMKSFRKYNPNWQMVLHRPIKLSEPYVTWPTGEQTGQTSIIKESKYSIEDLDFFDKIIEHDITNFGLPSDTHPIHQCDYLRWRTLGTTGGLWSDNDILFVKPVPENLQRDTYLSTFDDAHNVHAIFFLMACKNNQLFKNLTTIAKRAYRKNQYQCMGNQLLNYRRWFNVQWLPIELVSPISWENTYQKFMENKTVEEYPNSIGFHWFGGNPDMGRIEVSFENHSDDNTLFNNIIKYIGI